MGPSIQTSSNIKNKSHTAAVFLPVALTCINPVFSSTKADLRPNIVNYSDLEKQDKGKTYALSQPIKFTV